LAASVRERWLATLQPWQVRVADPQGASLPTGCFAKGTLRGREGLLGTLQRPSALTRHRPESLAGHRPDVLTGHRPEVFSGGQGAEPKSLPDRTRTLAPRSGRETRPAGARRPAASAGEAAKTFCFRIH